MPPERRKPADAAALKRFGGRIRSLRQERRLSQESLADRAKVARSYMSGIERGVRNCSVLHVIKLAAALKVEPSDLFRD